MLACNGPERAAAVDAVIVLGGGMDPDERLNFLGRQRVETALALLAEGKARVAIFTGAIRETDAVSEAELMRRHAISLGAAPERLRVEPAALTTLENLRFALAIARAEGLSRIAIVSDGFHLTRAGMLARLLDVPDAVLVASPGLADDRRSTRAALIWRETLAWWLNVAKAVGWTGLGWLGVPEAERGRWIP